MYWKISLYTHNVYLQKYVNELPIRSWYNTLNLSPYLHNACAIDPMNINIYFEEIIPNWLLYNSLEKWYYYTVALSLSLSLYIISLFRALFLMKAWHIAYYHHPKYMNEPVISRRLTIYMWLLIFLYRGHIWAFWQLRGVNIRNVINWESEKSVLDGRVP